VALEVGIGGLGPGVRYPKSSDEGTKVARSCRDLEVWQKAMGLVIDCYRLAGLTPDP